MSGTITPGTIIGQYRVLSKLGEGGMGEVFLAEDSRLRRKVALKLLPKSIASDQDRLLRFEREAHSASALNHPNILTIHEFGTQDENHYLVAEFVQGETLRERLNRTTLTVLEALDVAIQIASALRAAHEAGIIHRDIKPENVMIREDGYVKVLDFGLAKLSAPLTVPGEFDPNAQEAETLAQLQTHAGMILGTVAYMSPEQARGKAVDARADIFSLGVVLYEMLTHRRPFTGETTSHIIVAVLEQEPAPLSGTGTHFPLEVERIVSSALAKDPQERYQTTKALLADLKNVQTRLLVEAELERTPSASKNLELETKVIPAAEQNHAVQPLDQMAEGLWSNNRNLSHYRITSRIGAGGMGEVFLATDTNLKRKVALKLLPAQFTSNKQSLLRFQQEAQTASALNHPNIITIYEIGAENGLTFIATEFIEGHTLRQKMREGLLPLNEVIEIAQQVTSAFVAAHQAGIVHRDIKPENIMVRPDGLVKVLDFGLAKLSARNTPVDHEDETVPQALTKPGVILGTAHYMSPEQVRGQSLDARSDIFSLGAVMYEMLTGQGPFDRSTKGDVIAAILKENPPLLSHVKQDVPPELQRILAKALQKDKDDRYQTSKDLLIDLKSLSRELEYTSQMGRSKGPSAQQMPIRSGRFSVVRAALPIVILASLTIGAGWWFVARNRARTEMPLASSLKTAEVVSWRSVPGELYSTGTFSPDGMRVAFVTAGSGTRNIQVKQTSANAPPVQTTKDEFNNDGPIWSPDGEAIAFFSTRGNQLGIWRIPYMGGLPTLIGTVRESDTIPRLWSKTGKLYYEAKKNLFTLDVKSGQTAQLTNFDAAVSSVSISPDETQIAYITTEADRWDISIAPTSGGSPKQIVSGGAEIRNIVWHSDSTRILYSAPVDGVFQVFATDIGGGKPLQITFGESDSLMLDVSTDGTKILYGSSKEESDVWGAHVAKAEEFAVASDISSELWPNVSPDGKMVAFQSIRNLSQGNNLFGGAILIKSLNTDTAPVQLVANGYLPTWSPDGKRLAFMRVVGETHNIWTISDAGGEEKQLTKDGLSSVQNTVLPYNRMQASYFSWSPDNNRIAYPAKRGGLNNIWLVTADGSSDTQLTNNSDPNVLLHSPLWSSDGKRIAYASRSNKIVDGKLNYQLWVVDVGTRAAKLAYKAETFLRLLGWSEDETGLILAAEKGKTAVSLAEVDLSEISLDSGVQHSIITQPSTYIYNLLLSADRRMIAFVSHQDGKDNVWVIPSRGGTAKTITNNKDSRSYFSSLTWAPDGKTLFFGKQSRYSLLSMITNFR